MPRMLKAGLGLVLIVSSSWGFFAHRKINRLAVFTLPAEMAGFYKKNIRFLEEAAVNPDRRRYLVPGEAPRHFIDLDAYGDSAAAKLPRYRTAGPTSDTLQAHGILPWAIYQVYGQLKTAMATRNPQRILKVSADLGHYIADAHVPLHTTKNYDGQLTQQVGIHAFWESRLPELFSQQYDFYTGKARYIENVQAAAWDVIFSANQLLDSVLRIEKSLAGEWGDRKFSFETKGRQTVKVFAFEYANVYHRLLSGMVERQMKASVHMVGSIWYTAWIDAGQPDLKGLMDYTPTAEEIKHREEEWKRWKESQRVQVRPHEADER